MQKLTQIDDAFTHILEKATEAIKEEYFILPRHEKDPVYRERVYCYELYHQMRQQWPNDCPYLLNGELDKRGSPDPQGGRQPKPDLLVHHPGEPKNYAVIEVKSSRKCIRQRATPRPEHINKDLETLSFFLNRSYRRAIYLIYGDGAADAATRVQRCAAKKRITFELWLHEECTKRASHNLVLSTC